MQSITDSQATCRNHPSTCGIYFAAEQPWVKFCNECALNMALSGKKIQKDLSTHELDKKTNLTHIIQKMRVMAKQADSEHTQLGQIAERVEEQGRRQVRRIVVQFDQFVQKLSIIRDQLLEIYEQNFGRCAQNLYQRQTKVMLGQIQLKKQIEHIQMNFGSIVEDKCEGEDSFELKMAKWEQIIQGMNKNIIQNLQKDQINANMVKAQNQTKRKIRQMPRYSLQELIKQASPAEEERSRNSTFLLSSLDQNMEPLPKAAENSGRFTQLKLRSKSRKSQKRNEGDDTSRKDRRSSIRDISNLVKLSAFQL